MTGGWLEYVGVFLGATLLCSLLLPLAIRVSWGLGLVDRGSGRKGLEPPVPFLGGMALVLAFSCSVVVGSIIRPPAGGHRELVVVLGVAVFLACVGLVDDLKSLSPWPRLVAEVGSGLVVWNLGVGVTLTGVTWVDLALTVFWVVGITNAFNLLDNMDGLAAGLAAIASAAYFAIAVAQGQFLVAGLSAGLVGCAVGFLRRNLYPARIYMGDAGALFLGFLIAYLGMKLKVSGDGLETSLVPVLVCAIAIFDTTLVTLARLLSGRSPFQGGQDHVSHRHVGLGLPVPVAVGVIHAAAAGTGVLAFVSSRVDPATVWIIGGLVGVGMLAWGVLLWMVPVYPESRRRHFSIIDQTAEELSAGDQ